MFRGHKETKWTIVDLKHKIIIEYYEDKTFGEIQEIASNINKRKTLPKTMIIKGDARVRSL